MKIVRTVAELQDIARRTHAEGKTIGLVPTMGALHNGHLSLVNRARSENDVVVVSVFVNPTQFNNPDDLRTYPRTEEADCAKLENALADYVFIPSVAEVYPEKDTRVFDLGPVAEVMEGAMRPGHFNGVAQIVSRLFEWASPDRAYFGEKDFQQIAVIRRMARICGFDSLDIIACPIIREADGLALSSRNVRLTPEMRAVAPNIHRILAESRDYAKTHTVDETEKHVIAEIDSVPGLKAEYYTIVHPLTMQPLTEWPADGDTARAVGCVTVYAGDVRLIDNITY